MKNIKKPVKGWLLFLFLINLSLASCSTEPQPIVYGFDSCAHCRMTISDARYGAELVTKKGKIYKFDSIECMASFENERENTGKPAFTLVTAYESPEELVPVNKAVILQSEAMPSPMGMHLTAFKSPATAKQYQQERGGITLSWEEILALTKK